MHPLPEFRFYLPVFDHSRLQSLLNETEHPRVCNAMLQELYRPVVTDRAEVVLNVRIEHPADLLQTNFYGKRIERDMRPTAWSLASCAGLGHPLKLNGP